MKSGNPDAPPPYYDDPGVANQGYGLPPPGAPYLPPQGPPPPGAAYPAPTAPYAPAPPQANVVVVQQPVVQQPRGATVVTTHNPTNHCLHCCISIFFPPWIICWIYFCCTDDTKTTVVAN